jgi:tetratricopeptide (TPR) repeat protein
LVAAAPLLVGCQKIQARYELKQGNQFYLNENYRQALEQYDKGLALDPTATFAYRSKGLAAVALFRPGVKSAENDQYAELAVKSFRQYLEDYPTDEKVREYMISTLMNAERHEDALKELRIEAARNPNKTGVNQAIVTTLAKAGRLDEAFQWATRPGASPDPAVLYSIAVASWDKAYHDPMLDPVARGAVVDNGLAAAKRSIELKPDYFEAMAYYNLLFREKAKLELDPAKAQEWIAEADRWRDRAKALIDAAKAKEAAAGTAT